MPSPGRATILRCQACQASGRRCSGGRSRGPAGTRHVRTRRRRTAPCSSSGRRSRWWPRQTTRRNSRGSGGVTGLSSSQRVDVGEARPCQALRGLRRRGEVPGLRPCPRSARRTAARRPRRRAWPWKPSTLPAPPHCTTRRPPGFSAACRRSNSVGWSGIQWNDGGREDRVDRLRAPRARRGPMTQAVVRSGSSVSRAFSTIDGDPSTANTWPSGSRSCSTCVTRPEPQPASSTVSSPFSGSRSSTSSAHSNCGSETRS